MTHYREIEGDLIELFKKGEFDMIAHGCNCQKSMYAGIARKIVEEFIQPWHIDQRDNRSPIQRFGDMTIAAVGDNVIANLYTQLHPGPDFDINALKVCLKKLNYMFGGHSIGLPQIGCGIGGGDWNEVCKVIQEQLFDMNVTVVIYRKEN